MSQRLSEFLAREAGEYLDQLRELVEGPDPVDGDQILRLARGVRGSAQMAGAHGLAEVAERLEQAGRALATGRVPWNDAVRRATRGTVDDLRTLLDEAPAWGAAQADRARTAIERWDPLLEQGMVNETTTEVVPISALFYDDAGPHVVSGPAAAPAPAPAPAADGAAVPIESLLLRGEDALREALALRPRVDEALRRAGAGPEAAALLEEVFDLIRLAQAPARPA